MTQFCRIVRASEYFYDMYKDSNVKYIQNTKHFDEWLEDKFGVRLLEPTYESYEIVDDQKHLLFLMKFLI
jgi:hypothetical protein